MTTLQEIRAEAEDALRCERVMIISNPAAILALLAEVDRLKALCVRAAEQNGHSIKCMERMDNYGSTEICTCGWRDLLAELREAAK